jgi:oligoribonuclease NrnB/cAMP/cGMP phosphodiesterase (DHH superfamily)
MKQVLVCYHADCIDGFTSAYAAWKKFGDEAEYVPARYGDAPPPVAGRHVYVLDFSYSREHTIWMNNNARSFVALDHHKTAVAKLEGLSFCIFDLERSGAGMAWDEFHGRDTRPWLIDYVEDRDLWRFKLPHSKLVNSWIGAHKRDSFEVWDSMTRLRVEETLERGAAIEMFVDRYVEEMASQARRIDWMGYSHVPVVNAPYISISELLQYLAKDAPLSVGWFKRFDGRYQYSLRSSDQSSVDVSEIAKKFPDGGGHPHSAGFALPHLLLEFA